MQTAWRIVKTRYVRTAFDGKAARLYGGRWNGIGKRVVYTSENRALAVLEMLVNLQASNLLQAYSMIPVRFAVNLIESVENSALPDNWQSYLPPAAIQTLGDEWIERERSPVLRVPSVVVRGEHNFLLNPAHPHFTRLRVGEPEPFAFDPRFEPDSRRASNGSGP